MIMFMNKPASLVGNHPLSIEAIFPTFIAPGAFVTDSLVSNHPLSIEAIFPTGQSTRSCEQAEVCNHPLSIEAIFPTSVVQERTIVKWRVTILCQSRLFFPLRNTHRTMEATPFSNHPLSIEAIFPTWSWLAMQL